MADTYAAHHGLAIAQYLLVEGVAGMALGAMVLLIGLGLGATGNRRAGTFALVSGLAATTISLAQAVLGAAMAAARRTPRAPNRPPMSSICSIAWTA